MKKTYSIICLFLFVCLLMPAQDGNVPKPAVKKTQNIQVENPNSLKVAKRMPAPEKQSQQKKNKKTTMNTNNPSTDIKAEKQP